jgi:hypothetical protein
MALKCPTTAGGYWEGAIPVNRLNVVDIEHRTALKDQARAIRLTAQKLEAFSKDFPIDASLMEPAARLLIQRRLGDIRANWMRCLLDSERQTDDIRRLQQTSCRGA